MQQIQTCDRRKCNDRRAERAVSNWRRIRNQGKSRRSERRKSQPYQDSAGHRHWRTEARGTFKEGAKRECNEQQLEAAVFGDTGDAVLEDLEVALVLGELVKKNDIQNNPADRQQSEAGAIHGRPARHPGRHAINKDRNDQCRG